MLSHANLRYQLDNLSHYLAPRPGERSLSLLPPWHIYERSCGYFLYSRANTQVTSNPCLKHLCVLTCFPVKLVVHEHMRVATSYACAGRLITILLLELRGQLTHAGVY